MKTREFLFAILALLLPSCGMVEIDYPGSEKCDPQITSVDYELNSDNLSSMRIDKDQLGDMITLSVFWSVTGACSGDSVMAEIETVTLSNPGFDVYVGAFLKYGDEETNLLLSYSPGEGVHRYTGKAQSIAPKDYSDQYFHLYLEFSFHQDHYSYDNYGMLAQFFRSADVNMRFHRVLE